MKHFVFLAVTATWAMGGFAARGDEPAAGPTPAGGFTDVTVECGIAGIVAAHYRAVPKWWLSGMTLADLDGDGDLDLHLAGHGSPAAAALNDGKGRFTRVDPKLSLKRGVRFDNDIPYGGGEIRLPFDFDEDGRVHMLCSWHDGGGVMYLNNSPRGGAAGAIRFRRSHDLDVFCRGCAMVDVDRDGKVDFLYDRGKQIGVRFGAGDGTFAKRSAAIGGSFVESGFIPADVNGDGHVDLLMHGCTGGNFYSPTPFERRVLLNGGKGAFADATDAAGLDRRGGSIHGVGDVDHDGDADLICIEGKRIAIHLNDGRGRFTKKPGAVKGLDKVRNKPHSPAWGGAVVTDFDNDGVADVICVARYCLYVLRGLGGGSFAYANDDWRLPNHASAAVDEGLCFGDVNGDGMVDLVTCGPGPDDKRKGVSVYRNDLPKRHWLAVRPIGAKGNRSAAGAKIRLYAPGEGGKRGQLLWAEQVCPWGRQSCHSYYAAALTERHFGLGGRDKVDVEVEFCPSGKRVTCRQVAADGVIEVREQDGGSRRANR